MRLIAFFAAIAVLFALSESALAQSPYAATDASAAALGPPPTPSARAAGLRLLTWPGKVAAAPEPAEAGPATPRIWNPTPAPAPRPAALPASIYAPPPPAYAPPQAAYPARQRPARAAPAPAQVAAMTPAYSPSDGDYLPPHFYSLYREYGQRPDPIPKAEYDPKTGSVPLNAQFFASTTPDLAEPPPPVPHAVTTSGGRVIETVPPSPNDTPG